MVSDATLIAAIISSGLATGLVTALVSVVLTVSGRNWSERIRKAMRDEAVADRDEERAHRKARERTELAVDRGKQLLDALTALRNVFDSQTPSQMGTYHANRAQSRPSQDAIRLLPDEDSELREFANATLRVIDGLWAPVSAGEWQSDGDPHVYQRELLDGLLKQVALYVNRDRWSSAGLEELNGTIDLIDSSLDDLYSGHP